MAEITPAMKRAYQRARLHEWERARDYLAAIETFASESGLGPLMIAAQAGKAEAERGAAELIEELAGE